MATINRLSNIRATHVSYVRRGANRKEFFLMKSDPYPEPSFYKDFDALFFKSDPVKKLVYGVVYEPGVLDSQNEFASAEDIENAAHGFLADCRNIDLYHSFSPGVGTVVESYVAPADFSIASHSVKKGSWILVTKASDEVWQDIKNGVITGYSMAGTALKTPVEDFAKSFGDLPHSLLHALKNFFSLPSYDKTFFKKGDSSMDDTQIRDLISHTVNDVIKPLSDRLSVIENILLPAPNSANSNADIEPVIKNAVDFAVAPLFDRLRAIELSRGLSRQIPDSFSKNSAHSSVFAGLNI